ncbi:Uracil-DNA glycosylase superfamily [Kribbella flavida DSM 17836]|uniref:Uracil-DNA glycosylase superfamily n=1 Tax=Kribbella flavida (strain DSM 17836 / JCM 10339 / NBRC 14399) TaxID=479435 RepID=D2PWB0_KRIFD|nr:G/U mismatch-specific DNA glycosylase [Kribbella flavida]ADB31562.1 Uracil-DNA glycosylase superfamily [Kribbella flavida DSM 17836]
MQELPDLIRPGLRVLFSGINPSLVSAQTGHHFARPGNRFWPALHLAGFTPRRLLPAEQAELLDLGLGITNVVDRPTARADELSRAEYQAGGENLVRKVLEYAPEWLAVVGVTAYRTAFGEPKAAMGPQDRTIGATRIWILPNPSGLNAHYTLPRLGEVYADLRVAASVPDRTSGPAPGGSC